MAGDLIIAIMAGIVLGVAATRMYVSWVAERFKAELNEDFAERLISEFKAHVIVGYSEQHNGVIRLYSEKHEFLCQGTTLEELTRSFVLRYPDKRFVVQPDDQLFELLTGGR